MASIGENIKKQRAKMHLTQKDLAEKLFMTPQAISRWELNDVEPSLDALQAMAKIFGITVDELITGNAPEVKHEETPAESVVFVPVVTPVDTKTNTPTTPTKPKEEPAISHTPEVFDPNMPIAKCYECGCDIYLGEGREFTNKFTNEKRYLCDDCYGRDGEKYLTKKKKSRRFYRVLGLNVGFLAFWLMIGLQLWAYSGRTTPIPPLDYFINCFLIPFIVLCIIYVLIVNNTFTSRYIKTVYRETFNMCFKGAIENGGFLTTVFDFLLYAFCLFCLICISTFIVPIVCCIAFPLSMYRAYSKKEKIRHHKKRKSVI